MFRGLLDFFNVLMAWLFLKVCAFLIMIVGITYIVKTNEPPIIHQHTTTQKFITQNVIEPKPITIQEQVCNKISGCPVIDGVCVGCETATTLLK